MADKKISALTAATTPLAGTEVLPIVQSGATVKVAVSDLTAGRAISATAVTASTGNFIVGTSGQGIDFSATPGTGTSELLNDYEEGTFNATYETTGTNFTTITFSTQSFRYVKVGSKVFIQGNISTSNVDATGATGNIRIAGLPFTSASSSAGNNGRSTLSIANTGPWIIAPTVARVETSSTLATLSYYATTPATATTGLPVAAAITGAAASQNGITIAGCYIAA